MPIQPKGVLATRSPLRPNHIGLSIVDLKKIDGAGIVVEGRVSFVSTRGNVIY